MKPVCLCQALFAVVCSILLGTTAALARPSVLIIGQACDGVGSPNHLTFWKLPQLLHDTYGFDIGSCTLADVTPAKLTNFNAVIVCGLGGVEPDGSTPNHIDDFSMSHSKFTALTNSLLTYVTGGGGLYVYGRAFVGEGGKIVTDAVSGLLAGLGASVPYAQLHDSGREARQPDGAHVVYALAASIIPHAATAGVTNWWYPIDHFSYDTWTRPLTLDGNWTPLILTSTNATVQLKNADNTLSGAPVKGLQTIYAARRAGTGCVVLNGSENALTLFGYDYAAYANSMYGFIGMRSGLNGIPSQGLNLLVSSLRWLTTDNPANRYGGFVPPSRSPSIRPPPTSVPWAAPGPIGDATYYKGIFAIKPAFGGGRGTVAEFKKAATKRGCAYIVVAGDFEQMLGARKGRYGQAQTDWSKLVQACAAATDTNFVAFPALITRDLRANSFLIYQRPGASVWPSTNRLDASGKYVVDHENYVWVDCKGPMRTVFRFSAGQYPVWMTVNHDTLAVRTYDNATLVEDLLAGRPASQTNAWLDTQEQGDASRIVTMTLLDSPAQVARVTDFTFLNAGSLEALKNSFNAFQYTGGNSSYVSDGPQVQNWYLECPTRETCGVFYVPGSERCRVRLKVSWCVGLRRITLYDHRTPIRVLNVSGASYEMAVDLLHDMRHVLTAVIEDVNGKRAMPGALQTTDMLFRQYFCSDRVNIMTGWMTLRDSDGKEENDPATWHLFKSGFLFFGAPYDNQLLPGVDGSSRSSAFLLAPYFNMAATDRAKSEFNIPAHKITRAYENADVIIFETPIVKRKANSAGEGAFVMYAPYVELTNTLVAAKLTQYQFYRKNTTNTANSVFPSAMIADLSMTITDPDGVTLSNYWNGAISQYFLFCGAPVTNLSILHAADTAVHTYTDPLPGYTETLNPGDLLLAPDVGEGLFVLEGTPTISVNIDAHNNGLHVGLGRGDAVTLPPGAQTFYRLCHVIMEERGAAAQAAFLAYRDGYGIKDGVTTGYSVTNAQGSVTGRRFLLDLAADNSAWRGTIGSAALPQRLPVRVTGLNPKWTSVKLAMANNPNKEWFPLGVTSNGESYTTVDVSKGPLDLFIGQPVTTTNPDVFITLIRDPASGITRADVHNPLGSAANVTLSVPVGTFLAGAQTQTISVAANSATNVTLRTPDAKF